MLLIPQYIDFLIENNLTQSQFLLLRLLKENRADLIQAFKSAFPIEDGTMIPRSEIRDLLDREFLIHTQKGFKLGDKFKDIFITPERAVDEIYDIYPSFMESAKGTNIPLVAMDKRVFKELYIPKIYGDLKEHEEVLKDIQFGIEQKMINMGLNKFVTSEQWKPLRKLRTQANTTEQAIIHEDF